jgi:carboxyl-terminal processing protease
MVPVYKDWILKTLLKSMKLFPLLLSLLILAGTAQAQSPEVVRSAQKVERFLDFVDEKYLEDVDLEALVEDALKDILEDLDPHSSYFSAEDLQKANEPLVGNFEGIGIQFNILKDTIYVISTISGGPSEKVGIMSGDKILEVDGENVAGIGIKNQGVMDRLRGKKGTEVAVGIKRKGKNKLIDFNITRDKIPLYSVDAGYMADPQTGYIKINRFASSTASEFSRALFDLKSQGMENLILDLRGNSGGYLTAALQLSNEFLKGRKLIVYTEGRAYPRQDAFSDDSGGFTEGKLVVLIDEGSASASEIVSGAVQDWDRAVVIGRRSFGKGLVQRPFSFPDGSAVRLTVQRYYTPSGRSIQRSYGESIEDYHLETVRRLESGELTGDALAEFPDSLKYFTQHNKRVVFGGGGIMPDIFIPLDTSFSSDYFDKVFGQGLLNRFSLEYVDAHREELLKAYPEAETFAAKFKLDKKVWNEFVEYAEAEGVEPDEEGIKTSKERLTLFLEGMFARNLWDIEAYFMVINQQDNAFQKALASMYDNTFESMKIAAR